MPKVNWGFRVSDHVDDFDRSSQFKIYTGPKPPTGAYLWRLKVLKHAAETDSKAAQLRPGLELVPRAGYDEKKYAGFYTTAFLNISDNERARGFWVPFLDALGVTGREFQNGTMVDNEGNVTKIGKWVNRGDSLVIAQLSYELYQDEWKARIGRFQSVEEDYEEEAADGTDEDDEYDSEYDGDEEDGEYDDDGDEF